MENNRKNLIMLRTRMNGVKKIKYEDMGGNESLDASKEPNKVYPLRHIVTDNNSEALFEFQEKGMVA